MDADVLQRATVDRLVTRALRMACLLGTAGILSGCMVATATMAVGSAAVAAGGLVVSTATIVGGAVVSGGAAAVRAVTPDTDESRPVTPTHREQPQANEGRRGARAEVALAQPMSSSQATP